MKTLFLVFARFWELDPVEIGSIIMLFIAWSAICYLAVRHRIAKGKFSVIFSIISISALVAVIYVCSLSPRIPSVLIFLLGTFPAGFTVALLVHFSQGKRSKKEIEENERD